eukprot:3635958-Alexandrium_andersonii.AAC.1
MSPTRAHINTKWLMCTVDTSTTQQVHTYSTPRGCALSMPLRARHLWSIEVLIVFTVNASAPLLHRMLSRWIAAFVP